MMNQSKLRVTRAKEFVNSAKKYDVLINKTSEFSLTNGDVKSKILEPGTYDIQVKVGWRGSVVKSVTINPEETTQLKVSNTKGFNKLNIMIFVVYFIFAVGVAFGDWDDRYVYIMLGVTGLKVILDFTWLKNKFLTIEQQSN